MSTRRRTTRTTRTKPYYRRRSTTSSDTLTGGTKDVNPQWFKGYITESGADTCTEKEFQLPITRIPTASKVTIIEVLKIRATNKTDNVVPEIATAIQDIMIAFSTASHGTTPVKPDTGDVFGYLRQSTLALTSGIGTYNGVMEQDLTDGAGHGILIATDKMYVQLDSLATTKTLSFSIEMLYRFKTVGMREYVGIVQSQQ